MCLGGWVYGDSDITARYAPSHMRDCGQDEACDTTSRP